MPARKYTLYLHDAVRDRLQLDHDDSMTSAVNARLARYADVVEHHAPTLPEAEWSALVDALNGCALLADPAAAGDTVDIAHWLHAELHDAELGAKWGIDSTDLEGRLREMAHVERVAIVEIAHRFWAHPQLNELSARELLTLCGARIAG